VSGSLVMKPGPERTRRLLDALGAPDRSIPCIVQVAGTNGKGSTAAMLESILRAAGRRTALFISPPLDHEGQSLLLDGRPVGLRRMRRWLGKVDAAAESGGAAAESDPPTVFERLAASAVLAAAEARAGVLILEAGLGGAMDATSAVARTDLAVITSIALDHRQWLGPTLEDIAREKAGIIRGGVPVVTTAQEAALEVIRREARRRGAPVLSLGREFDVGGIEVSLSGTRFTLLQEGEDPWPLACRLLGAHQAVNAAAAAAAARVLGVDRRAVEQGLAAARWPGRCELARRRPPVLLDGAHNPAGMAALRRAVDLLFPGRELVLVCGMLADKDVDGAAAAWRGRCRLVLAVAPPNPRALPAGDLAAAFRRAGAGPVEEAASWQEGLARGLAEVEARPGAVLCACGSLYLVGPARRWLRRRQGGDPPAVGGAPA